MLSSTRIDRLKPEATTKRYSDRDGLTLEVRKSGKKVFIFRFQWDKKPQTITIGRYPSTGLATAREKATEYRSCLDLGIDPREKSHAANTDKVIFKIVAEQWYEKHYAGWRENTHKKHRCSLDRDIYPIIGNRTMNEITRAHLLQVIHPHESLKHHEVAHRLHSRLRAIFEFAIATGITENYPFNGLKKALIPKPRVKNQDAISPSDAHAMFTAIENSQAHKVTKLYLMLLAHLFVRPSELRFAKWTEFNLQQAEWHIPIERMKMKAPHWVPLSTHVVAILRELRLLTGFTPYLFNSPNTTMPQPISETSARKILHKSGYKNRHTLHGYRSLASTVLHSESHFRSDAVEAQLSHKVQGVRGVYLRADFKQERRELMEWYSGWLVNAINSNNLQQVENI